MFRIGLLLIIVVCVVMGVTNPDEKDHKEAVYRALSQEVGGEGILGRLAGTALDSLDLLPLEYHNYVLLSTVTLEGDTVSVGLLTRVWAMKRDE